MLRGRGQKKILSHQNSSVSVLDTFGPFLLIVHTLYCMLLSDSVLNVELISNNYWQTTNLCTVFYTRSRAGIEVGSKAKKRPSWASISSNTMHLPYALT